MAIDINDHFGRKVKDTRRELGLSQLELAEVSKVDLSTINRLERGEANITLRNAFKISKALKMPLADLLKV